jgi:hypothetical protein
VLYQLSYLASTLLFIARSEVTGATLPVAYNEKPALSARVSVNSKRTNPIACASHLSRGARPGGVRTQHAAEVTLRKLSIAQTLDLLRQKTRLQPGVRNSGGGI